MSDQDNWYKGSRWVVAFPRLGIVVKLPRICWLRFKIYFLHLYHERGLVYAVKQIRWNEYVWGGYRVLLTKGLRDNWRELWFYWFHRSRFLQPTYFSLFGLLNIQLLGKILTEEEFDKSGIFNQARVLTQRDSGNDGHHFASHTNFCHADRGKDGTEIRMVDYGSPPTQEVLLGWANALTKITLKPR